MNFRNFAFFYEQNSWIRETTPESSDLTLTLNVNQAWAEDLAEEVSNDRQALACFVGTWLEV